MFTDNPTGYTVTVQAAGPALIPLSSSVGTIPIGDIQAREHGTVGFSPLSATAPLTLHSQQTPSAANGDPIASDYQITIPNVTSGTYAANLQYIAMTS